MFGHGEKHCNVKTKCAYCSESHKTSECANAGDSSPKCSNCKQSHPSTDQACISRSKYLEMQERTTKKKPPHPPVAFKPINVASNNNNVINNNQPNFDSMHIFPSLPLTANRWKTNPRVNQQQQIYHHSQRQQQQQQQVPQQHQQQQQHLPSIRVVEQPLSCDDASQQNDLFSQEELASLTMEMISKLSQCKTKFDQFNVIAQLATKYLYCHNGK